MRNIGFIIILSALAGIGGSAYWASKKNGARKDYETCHDADPAGSFEFLCQALSRKEEHCMIKNDDDFLVMGEPKRALRGQLAQPEPMFTANINVGDSSGLPIDYQCMAKCSQLPVGCNYSIPSWQSVIQSCANMLLAINCTSYGLVASERYNKPEGEFEGAISVAVSSGLLLLLGVWLATKKTTVPTSGMNNQALTPEEQLADEEIRQFLVPALTGTKI